MIDVTVEFSNVRLHVVVSCKSYVTEQTSKARFDLRTHCVQMKFHFAFSSESFSAFRTVKTWWIVGMLLPHVIQPATCLCKQKRTVWTLITIFWRATLFFMFTECRTVFEFFSTFRARTWICYFWHLANLF